MFVTFVSQCEKKALKRTRQVLDAFANRIGDNTWQTVITQEGLNAVKKLLRKTASKSTAVSCHWMRSRSRTELLWAVGQKEKFNQFGIVPVNSTKKNILHSEWGNNWSYASIIQIASVIAALLHDIGKTTVGFQNKLRNASIKGDPYRHEWISICLFQAMIADCETDKEWLERFSNLNKYLIDNPEWLTKVSSSLSSSNKNNFDKIPPLGQLITWLIVTHHRMPFKDIAYFKNEIRQKNKKRIPHLQRSIKAFYKNLKPIEWWVKNIKYDESTENDFWEIKDIVIKSRSWQKTISRWASKALNYPEILSLDSTQIANPIILYLSRISLMFGDHNYSSLEINSDKSVRGDINFKDVLIANTDRKTKEPKQALDEHLLGVAKFTARFAHIIPQFSEKLSVLSGHKTFSRNTSIDRFKWQNKSYALAKSISKSTAEKGFFGVNMASTGCGKTLANARIMYALSDEKNVRFTIALGLRILTLQTGIALREKLDLDDSELAVLVGGAANKSLFELSNNEKNKNDEIFGAESSSKFIDEDVDFEGDFIDEDELGTIISDEKARKLLYAPIVSCTVDHIMSASENARGGKHIVPILRLLSGDLVLDEPDDFSLSDLPALTRLVHLAGLFGRRVILSSATLTPDFSTGLFNAYKAGRELWDEHLGLKNNDVVCAWFDENKQTNSLCANSQSFIEAHNKFCFKRADYLHKLPAKRIAEILSVKSVVGSDKTELFSTLAKLIIDGSQNLHHRHHDICPKTQKCVSIGLVRIAHIKSLIKLAQSIYQSNKIPTDTKIHLCCYHSRQLLLLRNNIEVKLDRILNRKEGTSIFDHPEIYNEVSKDDKTKHHVFIVIASPVAEIGRDHDYDWAIIEPSSMRSIIQLVGRVWRHRYSKEAGASNILILENNIKALESGNNLGVGKAVFAFPGFEDKEDNFLLETHNISELLTEEQLNKIDSTPRIIKSKELLPKKRLADLEHSVMETLLNNPELNFVNAFWFNKDNENRATVHLQKLSPFRANPEYQNEEEFVCIPVEAGDSGYKFCYRESAWEGIDSCVSQNQKIVYKKNIIQKNDNVSTWLNPSIEEALESNMGQTAEIDSGYVALRYCYVILDDNKAKWHFNPYLGFWND
jgi:CRISPR-associated endonuclease/helicase Cas3